HSSRLRKIVDGVLVVMLDIGTRDRDPYVLQTRSRVGDVDLKIERVLVFVVAEFVVTSLVVVGGVGAHHQLRGQAVSGLPPASRLGNDRQQEKYPPKSPAGSLES